MSSAADVTILESIALIPVVELEPFKFSTGERNSLGISTPDEWFRYWLDSLADSGITDLRPLQHGSWHVPTENFDVPNNLQRFLEVTFKDWGGIETLSDPDCNPVLDGGLALRSSGGDILVEPGCCADLGDANNWVEAGRYQGAEWQMLWIGHPWLSIRYRDPWLILSERHESSDPCDRWFVRPDELDRALKVAFVELERFATQMAGHLSLLGYPGDSLLMGRKLAGLSDRNERSI